MTLLQSCFSVFGFSFLSATILPFSSEAALYLALKIQENSFWIILFATIGNSLGGLTNYFIGKIGNQKWLSRFGYQASTYEKHQRFISKYGGLMAFLSWIPIIGDPLLISLGLYRYNLYKLTILMTLGKLLRYSIIWYLIQLNII